MPAPAGVPVVCVGHAVLGDLSVVVPLDVPDAHAVLARVLVLTALAVVDVLAMVVDVLVLAVLAVLAVLVVLEVLSVHVHVFGVPGLTGALSPVRTFTSSLAVRSRRTRQRRSWW